MVTASGQASALERLIRRTTSADGPSRKANAVPRLTECRAVYAYVARTPSRLVLISLEDMLGDSERRMSRVSTPTRRGGQSRFPR